MKNLLLNRSSESMSPINSKVMLVAVGILVSSLAQAASRPERMKVYNIIKGGGSVISYTLNKNISRTQHPLAYSMEIKCADPLGVSFGIQYPDSEKFFYEFADETSCFDIQRSLIKNSKQGKVSCLILRKFKLPYGGSYLYPVVESESSCN